MNVTKLDTKIAVAVSGGVDSMVLLDCYLKAGQDLAVVNIEHGLRGERSLSDSAFVKDFCEKRGIEFLGYSVNVNENRLQGESIETAARRLRYEIFESLLNNGNSVISNAERNPAKRALPQNKISFIALAHHLDDNAETMLMRILRGTGLSGLSGIGERGNYLRPFLNVTREEIERYAKENNVPYVVDETNFESDATRNFLRNEVFSVIRKRFPDYAKQFANLQDIAREADGYLNEQALTPQRMRYGCKIIGLYNEKPIIQKYSVKKAFALVGVDCDIEARHLALILNLSEKKNNVKLDMPWETVVSRSGADFHLSIAKEEYFDEPFDRSKTYAFRGETYAFVDGTEIKKGITLDLDKLPDGCVIRTRLDGDTFKSVNGRTKLLSDYLNAKKLNAFEKAATLVLACGLTVYAVLGLEVADAVKVDEKTKTITEITKKFPSAEGCPHSGRGGLI